MTYESKTKEQLVEDLRECRRKLAELDQLYDTAPTGLCLLDTDLRFVRINHALAAINGGPTDAYIGLNLREFVPDLAPDLEPLLSRVLRTGEPILRHEVCGSTPGQPDVDRHLLVSFHASRSTDGAVVGINAVVENITERKTAERDLALLGFGFEHAGEAVFIGLADGSLLYVNEAACRLLHYSRQELMSMSVSDLSPHFSGEEWATQWAATREARSRTIESELQAKDGSRVPVELLMNFIEHEGEEQFCTFGRDISERRRAEAAIRESEARYRTLFESSRDAIMTLAPPTWRFTAGNPATVAMFRARDETDFTATGPWELSPEFQPDGQRSDKKARAMIDAAMREGSNFFEWCHKRLDGEEFLATVLLARVQLGGDAFLQATVRDISDQKRAEQERQAMEAQLLQSQKLEAIGTLAGGVAHEINNPITGIMNYAQLIIDRVHDEDPPITDFSNRIIKEVERVAAIVKNLLAFARHDKQQHRLAAMSDIVDTVLSLVHAVLRRDQIVVELDVPKDLPHVWCRSQQIQQVLMNLLTNARDALNERYPGYDERKLVRIVSRQVEKNGRKWVRTTVEDHGPGIAHDVSERVFDPFFTTKPKDKGTGLGLSISHGIVKEHAGNLWVESEEGVGTRFNVDLPALEEEPCNLPPTGSAGASARQQAG